MAVSLRSKVGGDGEENLGYGVVGNIVMGSLDLFLAVLHRKICL